MAWLEGEGWHLLWDSDHPTAEYIKINEDEGKVLLAPAKKQENSDYFVDEKEAEEAQIIEKRKSFSAHCYVIKDKDGKIWQVYWDSTDCYYNIMDAGKNGICRDCKVVRRW